MKCQPQQQIPQPSELLARASEYVACGWSLLPLCGKLPARPWKALQARRPLHWELREWFFDAPRPATGIGIVTGAISGLVVIDCDSKADAAYWQKNYPQSPLVAETGNGGLHFYYALRRDKTARNRTKVLGRSIDVRGEGGYVAAPPSLHASGRRYRWASFEWRAMLPVFDPAWLQTDERAALSGACFPKAGSQKVRHAAAYIKKIHAHSGKGGHNATFRAACRLRDAGLSEAEALALLYDWNETNASPPWSAAELEHKIRSAYRALDE